MIPLLDSDLLLYQVGFGCQFIDEDTGDLKAKPFDSCVELLENILQQIKGESWAEEDPVFYFTGDRKLADLTNKNNKRSKAPPVVFKPNFRESLAVTKPYKGNRSMPKPLHYDNIRGYILSQYECKIAWGMEADDLVSIDHRLDPENTIICSRDKDLRITPGRHYGWSCHNQPSFGPKEINALGYLERVEKKLEGGGLKFFYAQMIMGDATDCVPGIPGKGLAYAYKILADCQDEEQLNAAVVKAYSEYKPEGWEEYFKEQAGLLWMVQELDAEGNPVMFKPFWER